MVELEVSPVGRNFVTPKDWFGIAIRVLGVWTFIEGVRGFVMALGYERGWFAPRELSEYYMLNSIVEFIAGVALMRGADLIVKFCYPEHHVPPEDEPHS